MLRLGIHSAKVFDRCLNRFDQRIEEMVDQARAFDSTDKFLRDLESALPFRASVRRDLARCMINNFVPGDAAPVKA